MKYIRKKYGNDGYATWFILLEQLTDADDHHIYCDEFQLTLLADECGVSVELLAEIIADLVAIGKFTAELWTKKRVLYCEELRDSLEDAYRKRLNKCVTTTDILSRYGLTPPETDNTAPETQINSAINTQSKVKESKEREEEDSVLKPPDFSPAEKALAAVRDMGKYEPIARSSIALFELIEKRSREEPDWWKKIADYAEIGVLSKQQRQDSIKQWANHTIKDKPHELWNWEKAEASLQSWLIWERRKATSV